MVTSRRSFVAAVFSTAAGTTLTLAQTQPSFAQDAAPPMPGPRRPPPEPRRDPRLELKLNQEAIKKDITRLSALVADLKKDLEDNDTKEVLSINVIRKTEEIEK